MIQNTGYLQHYNHLERNRLIKGLDISRYQYNATTGYLDFATLGTTGLDFIVVKAGGGGAGGKDIRFTSDNVAKMKALGLKVGTYYFSIPSSYGKDPASARQQANYYADYLESTFGTGTCGDLLPVLDFEDSSATWASPDEAFQYIKAFKEQMIVRFPQLTGKGIMLYIGTYYLDNITGGDIKSASNVGISAEVPYLWLAANACDSGAHTVYNPTLSYPNIAHKVFGGYTKWTLWQHSSDRTKNAKLFGMEGNGLDMDILDESKSLNDILVYSETKPDIQKALDGKANKNHSHAGHYLPVINGALEGKTYILSPDLFVNKVEGSVSWRIARKNTVANATDTGYLVLTPSIETWAPMANPIRNAETWDTSKEIIIKPNGEITIGGKKVLVEGEITAGSPVSDATKIVNTVDGTNLRYVIAARIKIGTAWKRVMTQFDIIGTGDTNTWGTFRAFLYHTTAFNVKWSSQFLRVENNTPLAFTAGDVVIVESDNGTAYLYDIYVKVQRNGYTFIKETNKIIDTSTSITLNPNSGTTVLTLPAVNDTFTLDGTTYTVKAVNNAALVTK